jgi:hypothetical protein
MCVTTTVNFRDEPAGCIIIVDPRETARLFSGGKDNAAWFLTGRTYEDNATARAMEELQRLSREMEEIVACCDFTFKENLMSGNPVANLANSKKVIGLIWNMAADWLADEC